MLYLPENLRKFRMLKGLTQEDVADMLGITPQSVSKWERGESCPDIALLPALANIYETSIDLLMGMDAIRAAEAQQSIHRRATEHQRSGDYDAAEEVYRSALRIYPNQPGMILGLAGTLALAGRAAEAIALMEKGLTLPAGEKHKATVRAALCFLYLQTGEADRAERLALQLPHVRESREAVLPLVRQGLTESEIAGHVRRILLGEE